MEKKYVAFIEIKDGQINKIMQRLDAAKQEIYDCYRELENLGVVSIKENAASDN